MSLFENFVTDLSKKYKPLIAKSDLVFLGFSFKDTIFLFFINATPKSFGFLTL